MNEYKIFSMCEESKLQLNPSSIINVPIHTYINDFSFIINGKEFKTSRLFSDLLSTKISNIHLTDPTQNYFILNTKYKGDFSHILKLINFNQNAIPEDQIPFVLEVLEYLGNKSIEIIEPNQSTELTFDNIFTLIEKHQKFEQIYFKRLSEELAFISTHFYELCEVKEEEFEKLNINSLIKIISDENLQLKNEDQLLKFVNKLYSKSSIYSQLYEYVYFQNVKSATIKEFLKTIQFDDITITTWSKLCLRLQEKINKTQSDKSGNESRYKYKEKLFSYDPKNEFSGIFKYLRDKSNDQIENEIEVTASSHFSSHPEYDIPMNVTLFEEQTKSFISEDIPNNWLLFDFKKNRIIPTNYTIRSRCNYNGCFLSSWVIEGSDDKINWETIDQQNNCSYLKGQRYVHTFEINSNHSEEFQYIRLRQTGKSVYENSFCNNRLIINSIEFYGILQIYY